MLNTQPRRYPKCHWEHIHDVKNLKRSFFAHGCQIMIRNPHSCWGRLAPLLLAKTMYTSGVCCVAHPKYNARLQSWFGTERMDFSTMLARRVHIVVRISEQGISMLCGSNQERINRWHHGERHVWRLSFRYRLQDMLPIESLFAQGMCKVLPRDCAGSGIQ